MLLKGNNCKMKKMEEARSDHLFFFCLSKVSQAFLEIRLSSIFLFVWKAEKYIHNFSLGLQVLSTKPRYYLCACFNHFEGRWKFSEVVLDTVLCLAYSLSSMSQR